MTWQFERCSELVRDLTGATERLEQAAVQLDLPPLTKREWYELLRRKLKPQLGEHAFLIVGIVGGTNIGKSVVFNHIAGSRVSSSSPMASGTRHPTALIPRDLFEHLDLPDLFPGFTIRRWERAEQPLQEAAESALYYRLDENAPANLIILDTPDVDSVAQVNWARADNIRQSADVLIALLTQQKYNDAAVKEFFRKAAREDKLVIVVFNQCLLPDDEEYWPIWLQTFCDETGVKPHMVYLCPNDRPAAEAIRLPFHQRAWPLDSSTASEEGSGSLLKDLGELHFGEIKVQALSGALRQLVDPREGVPSWLQEIRRRAGEFHDALDLMSAQRLVEIDHWPTLPNAVLVEQIRGWWRDQREGWTASVHGFYNRLGQVIAYPVRKYREYSAPERPSILETYRQTEWKAILEVLERCIERLCWLRDLGNPILAPRLETILGGGARHELIERVRAEHDAVDFERAVRELVDSELSRFRDESPDFYRLFRRLDSAAAAARPAVSVVLFMTGAGPLGDTLAPVIADSAMQGVLHVAGDAVGGTVVTAMGDKVITDTSSSGAGYLEARFRQLHAAFARQRATWMADQLDRHLFKDLPSELTQAAQVVNLPEFQQVGQIVADLKGVLAELASPAASSSADSDAFKG